MSDPKIALVTGASRGLGAALTEALAARGWHVVAVARTVGGLEEVDDRVQALKLPGQGAVTLAPMDITNEDAMRHLCRSIFDRWGHLDMWLHTAIHAAPLTPAGHIDGKDWTKSVDINLRATGQLIPLIEPLLRAAPKRAKAVFFDDARTGEKFFGSYAATKAGQIALARAWASENKSVGPEVNIVEPAPMATALRARFFPGEERDTLAHPKAEAEAILSRL